MEQQNLKFFAIDEQLRMVLMNYLDTKPHMEVRRLIDVLSQLKPVPAPAPAPVLEEVK